MSASLPEPIYYIILFYIANLSPLDMEHQQKIIYGSKSYVYISLASDWSMYFSAAPSENTRNKRFSQAED